MTLSLESTPQTTVRRDIAQEIEGLPTPEQFDTPVYANTKMAERAVAYAGILPREIPEEFQHPDNPSIMLGDR